MNLTRLLKIDGNPMVPPDADMNVSFEDLDSSDSGRDDAIIEEINRRTRMMGKSSNSEIGGFNHRKEAIL